MGNCLQNNVRRATRIIGKGPRSIGNECGIARGKVILNIHNELNIKS
jgi:hypothetical protein